MPEPGDLRLAKRGDYYRVERWERFCWVGPWGWRGATPLTTARTVAEADLREERALAAFHRDCRHGVDDRGYPPIPKPLPPPPAPPRPFPANRERDE